ncbi:MMPL family transporter [Conexibacter sp. JD483]|uniref:MMPL family transporter n=1 Tax=unclassified Conexibacter TaxID=2627773 RepID=UPI002715E855|nr:MULTISPECIES: MMPL family transporter [unclassified Conexibacter]MDO8187450.1 MMPL family transporter [Conexibacter sp. CPCC 205706]MDO8198684.1 MMPL family transporter [Conexibacter sp. CPCC 205762]MDR9369862.1 MMPL family transporter [Conexibacter sp. JD483]
MLVLVVLGALSANAQKAADDFKIPGAESQKATDLFRAHAPALAGADAQLVFTVRDGAITDPGPRAAIESALTAVRRLKDVAEVGDPFTQTSRDGRLATTDVRWSVEATDLETSDAQKFETTVRDAAQRDGVEVQMRGQVPDLASQQDAPVGELIGVAIAIVLLTLLFRSGAAMAGTLIGALIGVMSGQLLLAILAKPLGLPEFAATIAIMLGLGAGIDYSLLIIGRYREQVAAGDSPEDAAAKSAATSGASVVAAGVIVIVALAGLLAIGIPLIGALGIAAAIGVACVVLSSLLVLPAMIGGLKRWLKPKKPEHVLPSAALSRWGETVTKRPVVSIVLAGILMLALAYPTLDMRLGQPDDGNQPAKNTQRKAYDQLAAAFGAGFNGPLFVTVETPRGGDSRAGLTRLENGIRAAPDVESVSPAAPSRDGAIATIFVTPRTAPQDQRTTDLVDRLRDETIPAAVAGTQLKVYVGGQTASFQDFSAKVSSRLPVFIAIVIGLSVLLLMAAFRSLWIPLISAVFNLLSVGAAFGVTTLVFQKGWGASVIGAESDVPIISFFPVMLFAILFGLSMDYNVFLLSRVREAYQGGDGPRDSVVHGVARIGKVILFAGLIMASVFLAFILTSDTTSKMFGVGLGFAILLDVLFVRLVIAPAVVTLLGDRAWWMPAWMDRVIPNISLDGHEVDVQSEEELEAAIKQNTSETEKV